MFVPTNLSYPGVINYKVNEIEYIQNKMHIQEWITPGLLSMVPTEITK